MTSVVIANQTQSLTQPLTVAWCASFGSKLRGLMFRPSLGAEEGILMVQTSEDRVNAAIHMFFMQFDIAVIWLDRDMRVVDRCLARRWRPMYAPARPAKYILEIHPNRLQDFQVNDQLSTAPCEK